jgi:hypothetical protein
MDVSGHEAARDVTESLAGEHGTDQENQHADDR